MKQVIIKALPKETQEPEIKVNKTLQPTKKSESNVEAEKGETVVTDLNFDGLPEFYKIAGKSHAQGGTPLNLTDNSFIFSKDKDLKIKDEDIQKEFQRSFKKGGYTVAELSKKYDINKYRQVLADPNSDKLQRKTAEMMIANYNMKLGKLALVQESMKGFPQGIPHIAMPYIVGSGFDPAGIYQTQGQDVSPEMDYDQAQKGKEIKPKTKVSVDNIPAYDDEEKLFLQKLSPDIKLPEDFVENKQGTKEGVFGRFDKKSADSNWDWYGKPINWNNPSEVAAAQKAYNARIYDKMINAGYSPKTANLAVSRIGFVPNGNLPNSLDAKAGKYTETRKDFDIPKKPAQSFTETPVAKNTLNPIPTNKVNMVPGKNPAAPFWLQDQINAAGAFMDLNKIKKYMPWQAPVDLQLPEATYYDPNRELADNAEQANIASQAIGMYTGPQQLNARLAAVQGSALSNAANILGKYNNLNVGVSNQFADRINDITNQENLLQADNANNLYKDTLAVNQNFDNSKALAREKFRGALTNAITNRAQTQSLNFMNEQYQVDPASGGFTYFDHARPFNPTNFKGQGAGAKSTKDYVAELMTSIPNMTAEVAYKIATGK